MRDKIKSGVLLAYYGGLLNGHQREIMQMYYDNDMSLAEISEVTGVTRQAVRDIVVRCTAKLEECERQLGLAKKIRTLIYSIEQLIERGDFNEKQRSELENIISNIEEI